MSTSPKECSICVMKQLTFFVLKFSYDVRQVGTRMDITSVELKTDNCSISANTRSRKNVAWAGTAGLNTKVVVSVSNFETVSRLFLTSRSHLNTITPMSRSRH